MGVDCTHYVVLGVALKSEAKVKKYFQQTEKYYESIREYYDNALNDKISDKVVIIDDGMGCNYTVVGKVLSKGRECGLELTSINQKLFEKDHADIKKQIEHIDCILNTEFYKLPIECHIFTHWY